MRTFCIRCRVGNTPVGWWPRLSGTRASCSPASASSSPVRAGLLNEWSDFTTSVAQASSGLRRPERRQLDPLVLSRLCRQPSAVAAICVGVQSGQLSAAGRAAPSGAALDADDIAGETNQDRCEGSAPCTAGDLPDGGSGDPTGIVPSDSGADWAAAVAPHRRWVDHHRSKVLERECDGRWIVLMPG
jgi:hypothetical protein